MRQHVHIPRDRIAAFCRAWRIAELALFGSVLRDDFTDDSDVDVLVCFEPGVSVGMFDLVRMEQQLQELLGRRVDLIERRSVERSENYIRRRAILESAEVVYAA